jgi:hypothetical protein
MTGGASSWSPHGRQMAPPGIPVIVYGTRWYAATQLVRRHLDRLGVRAVTDAGVFSESSALKSS